MYIRVPAVNIRFCPEWLHPDCMRYEIDGTKCSKTVEANTQYTCSSKYGKYCTFSAHVSNTGPNGPLGVFFCIDVLRFVEI